MTLAFNAKEAREIAVHNMHITDNLAMFFSWIYQETGDGHFEGVIREISFTVEEINYLKALGYTIKPEGRFGDIQFYFYWGG